MEQKRYYYEERMLHYASAISQLKHRNHFFISGEILTFLIFIGLIALSTVVDGGRWLLLVAVVVFLIYIWIRRLDVRNERNIHSYEDLYSVYEHEISYLDGNYSPFGSGKQYIDEHHAFTFDLDVFGQDSLFQRINRTNTTGGSDRLASYLSFYHIHHQPENVRNFAADESWRARFMALGQRGKIDTADIYSMLSQASNVSVPQWFGFTWVKVVSLLLLVAFFSSILLAIGGSISVNIPIWWGILQFFAIYSLTNKALSSISKIMDGLHEQMQKYIEIIRLCTQKEEVPDGLKEHFDAFSQALLSFEKMEKVIEGLDRRGNILGLFLVDTFALGDLFLIRQFIKWQQIYMDKIAGWIAMVSDVDALVSMGTFSYNEPDTSEAEIVDGDTVLYEANGLYHPFLGHKAIKNDFIISDRNFYIITGANMAGKSTFLRAIGVNYILALNGMPVFADHLRVSRFRLFSSMRTNDDLSHGISYFNAELLRLKQLIDFCKAPLAKEQDVNSTHTLIILDEILKGTNSLDKLNGSRLFLRSISQFPVTGVVATHDLELSKMSNTDGAVFHNYCFEIELGDDVTYSYKITSGVARNQNATFLLKNILSEN